MSDFSLPLDTREAHNLLVGVTRWTSPDPTRRVLTAVAFTGEAVWATDAYKLCRLPYARFGGGPPAGTGVRLVDGERLRWALGRYRSSDEAALHFGVGGVEVRRRGVTVHIDYTEGTWPDTHGIWEKSARGPSGTEPAAFDPKHLAAVPHLAPGGFGLVVPNGLGAARVVDDRYDEPIGLVMPVRTDRNQDLLAAIEPEVVAS